MLGGKAQPFVGLGNVRSGIQCHVLAPEVPVSVMAAPPATLAPNNPPCSSPPNPTRVAAQWSGSVWNPLFAPCILPANTGKKRVDPRGLEPLASAMRGRRSPD